MRLEIIHLFISGILLIDTYCIAFHLNPTIFYLRLPDQNMKTA